MTRAVSRVLLVLMALSVIATPVLAQPVAEPRPAPLAPRVALKVGALGALSDAGIFIAYERGWFSDEGLDIELIGFKAAPQILPSLASGEVQLSGSAVSASFFNAISRNVALKLVADKGQVKRGFGWAALVIRADLGGSIKEFKDLKGRRIAVPGKGATSTSQLGKALELGALGPADIEFVELGLPDMVAALANKAIDAATLLEPFVASAVAAKIAIRWKGMEDFLPFAGQNGVIVYSEAFAARQPEAARRWMAAYLRGTRAYTQSVVDGTDRDEINAILAKHTSVKSAAMFASMAPTGFDPNGRLEQASIEADQDWYIKLGLQTQRGDLSKIIDYQYVDYAVGRLGRR